VARLFIGLQLLKYDPSLSLHDDWQTALCIAGGYFGESKKVYVFELTVPMIETIGWTVSDVHTHYEDVVNEKQVFQRWFTHRGIYFDSDDPRTERYVLFEIPFFKQRCRKITIFENEKSIKEALLPFKQSQYNKYTQSMK